MKRQTIQRINPLRPSQQAHGLQLTPQIAKQLRPRARLVQKRIQPASLLAQKQPLAPRQPRQQ
jgi:hypothetical protein